MKCRGLECTSCPYPDCINDSVDTRIGKHSPNTPMSAEQYQKHLQRMKKYYNKNRAEVCRKARERYARSKHEHRQGFVRNAVGG